VNIDALVEERRLARERGDFKRADEIRSSLEAAGVVLRDRRDGTTRAYFKPQIEEEIHGER
jgi:cysteinyl-tRNA synthetase